MCHCATVLACAFTELCGCSGKGLSRRLSSIVPLIERGLTALLPTHPLVLERRMSNVQVPRRLRNIVRNVWVDVLPCLGVHLCRQSTPERLIVVLVTLHLHNFSLFWWMVYAFLCSSIAFCRLKSSRESFDALDDAIWFLSICSQERKSQMFNHNLSLSRIEWHIFLYCHESPLIRRNCTPCKPNHPILTIYTSKITCRITKSIPSGSTSSAGKSSS